MHAATLAGTSPVTVDVRKATRSSADVGREPPAAAAGRQTWRARAVDLVATALVAGGLTALFVWFALTRFFDGDEGVYGLTSVLVADGKLLYRDFFYPQMPVLPYVYGGWMEIVGESWNAARALSALLAAATGVLLYRYLDRRAGWSVALLGVGLFASSTLVLEWFATVKSYPLSTFLVVASCVLLDRARPISPAAWAGAGALFALAIGSRLYFAAALPAYAIAVLRSTDRPRAAGWFGAGFGLGALPILAYLVIDPGRFLWNVLLYQGVRSSGGLVGDFGQKLDVVARLLGFVGNDVTDHATGFQYLILLAGAVAALVVALRLRRGVPLPFWFAACLGAVSLAPTPTYVQYFVVTVPFLIMGTLPLLASGRTPGPVVARGVAPLVVASVAWLGGITLHRDLEASASAYPLEHPIGTMHGVEAVTRFVDDHARPGEEVMASWPGYLVGSHAKVVPGLEEHFAPPTAAAVAPEDVRRYRLVTARQVERLIHTYRTRLIVYHNWLSLGPRPDWRRAAREARYRPLARVGDAIVYEAPRSKLPAHLFQPVRSAATVPVDRVDFRATLRPQEVAGGGDARARGAVEVSVDTATGRICWALEVVTLGPPTGVVLRRAGPGGGAGPDVAQLGRGFVPSGCTTLRRRAAAELASAPSTFYVAVRSRLYPHGAVRGTVESSSPIYRFGASAQGLPEQPDLTANLVGYPATLGADPTGFATVRIYFADSRAGTRTCWAFVGGQTRGRPLRAEIRRGPPGLARPLVLRLGGEFRPRDCVVAPPRLVAMLRANPRSYHVAVTTTAYRHGAIVGRISPS